MGRTNWLQLIRDRVLRAIREESHALGSGFGTDSMYSTEGTMATAAQPWVVGFMQL